MPLARARFAENAEKKILLVFFRPIRKSDKNWILEGQDIMQNYRLVTGVTGRFWLSSAWNLFFTDRLMSASCLTDKVNKSTTNEQISTPRLASLKNWVKTVWIESANFRLFGTRHFGEYSGVLPRVLQLRLAVFVYRRLFVIWLPRKGSRSSVERSMVSIDRQWPSMTQSMRDKNLDNNGALQMVCTFLVVMDYYKPFGVLENHLFPCNYQSTSC